MTLMFKTENDLKSATSDFFKKYWNVQNEDAPKWESHWHFNGTIPNHDKRGCYALFKDLELIYIGVAIGRSTIQYNGHGLGDRLKNYWQVDKSVTPKTYTAREDWKGTTSIMTIGFNEEHYYMAAALEVYLIHKLDPPKNKKQKPLKN